MKQIIFRADDRLIHGQVIEGWIKNFNIPSVIIANDAVSADMIQQTIYRSVVPPKTTVDFYTTEGFKSDWENIKNRKGTILVIFASISDLYDSMALITDDVYVNIGCIASRTHCISVSDTVFLEPDELTKLEELASKWQVHIKKLPWEKDATFCDRQPETADEADPLSKGK